jgi:hypothetical protein
MFRRGPKFESTSARGYIVNTNHFSPSGPAVFLSCFLTKTLYTLKYLPTNNIYKPYSQIPSLTIRHYNMEQCTLLCPFVFSPSTPVRTSSNLQSIKGTLRYSPHFTRKSMGGGGGGVGTGAGRGECVLVGGLKGCYWWKTV